MKKRISWIASAVALAAILGYVSSYAAKTHQTFPAAVRTLVKTSVHASSPIPPPAYTITLEEVRDSYGYLDMNVRNELIARTILARKSDGSTLNHYYVLPVKSKDGKGYSHAFDVAEIMDVAAKTFRYAFKYLNAVQSYPKTEEQVRRHVQTWPTAESECMVSTANMPWFGGDVSVVGHETVLGHNAVIISINGEKSWYAPDVGCALVKTVTNRKDDKGRLVVNTNTASSIVLGEPDPALFSTDKMDELSPMQTYERKMDYYHFTPEQKAEARQRSSAHLTDQEYRYKLAQTKR